MAIASDLILDAAIAALNQPSVQIDGVAHSKPVDLVVEDHTAISIEPESLPYGSIRPVTEQMEHDSGALSTSTDRTLRFVLSLWAEGDSPRKALAPLIGWATVALQVDLTLGGLCNAIFEEKSAWSDEYTDRNRGQIDITFRAEYLTARNNQEMKL